MVRGIARASIVRIAVACGTLSAIHPAAAQSVSACFEDWPPYQEQEKDGTAKGLAVDLTRRILTGLGHDVSFEAVPYLRCVNWVRDGRYDMIVSSGGEDGLLTTGNFKVAWILGFMVPAESDIRAAEPLEAFEGRTVGIVHQFSYPSVVDTYTGWHLYRNRDDRQNLEMMRHGRLDAVLTDVPWALKQPDAVIRGLRYVGPPLAWVPQPDAFRPGLADLRDRYQKAQQDLIDHGTLDEIYIEVFGRTLKSLIAGKPPAG